MADLDNLDIGAYRAAIDRVNAAMPTEALARLRQLRLWAWLQVKTHRRCQEDAERAGLAAIAAVHKKVANDALGHVQTLNDFFPVGDNASEEETRTGAELLRAPKEPVL